VFIFLQKIRQRNVWIYQVPFRAGAQKATVCIITNASHVQ
jgi:hypothetical protein